MLAIGFGLLDYPIVVLNLSPRGVADETDILLEASLVTLVDLNVKWWRRHDIYLISRVNLLASLRFHLTSCYFAIEKVGSFEEELNFFMVFYNLILFIVQIQISRLSWHFLKCFLTIPLLFYLPF
jgi:hypothetical protein